MPKNKLDQINDAFISVLAKENAKGYEKYIKSINQELIDNVDSLTPEKVKAIIKNAEINIDNIALLFLIQNAVMVIVGTRLSKADKLALAPILALTDMYSLKKPKRFVEKIVKITNGVKLNPNEKIALDEINKFGINNTKTLNNAKVAIRSQLNRSTSKSTISKRMIRDLNIGLRQDKSLAAIKKEMVLKYNKLSNVERTLDTELHASSELVRQTHAETLGLTHKTWKTQQDGKVRNTCFHNKVTNKRIPIESEFKQCGLTAKFPGDTQLPPSDRIRCRCWLDYD